MTLREAIHLLLLVQLQYMLTAHLPLRTRAALAMVHTLVNIIRLPREVVTTGHAGTATPYAILYCDNNSHLPSTVGRHET